MNRKLSSDVRVSHLSFTLVIEEMLSGPSTVEALAEHSGLTRRSVTRLLRTMRAKKVVHIAGWEKDTRGRNGVKAWGLGPGKDAPRITKPRAQSCREWRMKRSGAALNGTPFSGLGARL